MQKSSDEITTTVLKPKVGTAKSVLALLLVAAGCLIAFWGNKYGALGLMDESYQAICVADYRNAPLAMLTFWIGHLWQELFGISILHLRNLTSLMHIVTVAVPCLFLFRQTRNLMLSVFAFLVCIILFRISEFKLYNWDTCGYLFTSVALTAVCSFYYTPRLWKAAVCGVMLGCMLLARLPSGIYAPVTFILLLVACRHNQLKASTTAISLAVLTLSGVATLFVLTCLMCGSPEAYIASYISDNIITGHEFDNRDYLNERFFFILNKQLKYWQFATAICLTAAAATALWRRKPWARWLIAAGAVLIAVAGLMPILPKEDSVAWSALGMAFPFFVALYLACPVINLLRGKKRRVKTPWFIINTCALYIVLLSFGSDAFFERWCIVFALPVATAALWRTNDPTVRRFILWLGTLCLIIVGILEFAFGVKRVEVNTFSLGDRHPELAGLTVSKQTALWVGETDCLLDIIKSSGLIYFAPEKRQHFLYLYGKDAGPHYNIFQFFAIQQKLSSFIDNVDVVIIPCELKYKDYYRNCTTPYLEEGYEMYIVKPAVTLMVRPEARETLDRAFRDNQQFKAKKR